MKKWVQSLQKMVVKMMVRSTETPFAIVTLFSLWQSDYMQREPHLVSGGWRNSFESF
jgi:hypothetical protein